MNQKDNTLYAFLKKNAAYSTGGNSSQRNSDMDSNRRPNFNEVNRSFNAPQNYAPDRTSEGMRQGNNHIFSDNASVLTFGAGQRDNNDRGMGRQDEGRTLGRNNINININNNNNNNNQLQSVKSYQSGTSSLRSSSSGFESARTEAVDILENLSDVVRKEINNIDYKLESFNKDVLRQLKEHTETYKKRVVWIIDQAFRENERHLSQIQRTQEQQVAGELVQIKATLQKEFVKIEGMRSEIRQQNWKKVAGEMLSSQLEEKVFQLVERGDQIHVRCPDWTQNTASSLRQIQELVRQSIRLQ